jgi:hypothetical protein
MPLMTAETAADIMGVVDGFYTGKEKSSNKLYDVNQAGTRQYALVGAAAAKADRRWNNAQEASSRIPAQRSALNRNNQTVLQYGKTIWTTNKGSGNCYERACLAAFVASELLYTGIYVAGISSPGDHAFCLVGGGIPAWKTAEQMDGAVSTAWVLDPWAATFCPVAEYPSKFLAMMGTWTARGMRIFFHNNTFNGWIEPSNKAYLTGFLEGPLNFTAAT